MTGGLPQILCQSHVFLMVLGAGKAKIRVLAGSGSSEDPLLGPQMAVFSRKKGQITGLFYKGTDLTDEGFIVMT